MMPEPAHSYRLKIEFAQSSDPGRDPNKQVNEDSCGYAETRVGHLMVLCDGMGGHYGGQEASRTAITTIFEVFEQARGSMTPAIALKAAIEEAGRRVYLLGGPPENRTRPGSTVVAMLLHDRGVDVAHVGDSRAYVIRSGQIYPLTRDHSMVQGMIDAGMLTEEQAIGHPDANKITRALGMKPEVEVEVRPEPMELFNGDILLQSSDGLTDLALGADILGTTRKALAGGSVAHACNVLVQMANDRGGHDNITVQMARVIEVGPKRVTIPGEPSQGPAVEPLTPAAPPAETIQMTKPDTPTPPGGYAAPLRPGMGMPGNASPVVSPVPAGSPVLPTATDVPPAAGVGLHGTFVMNAANSSLHAQLTTTGTPISGAAALAPTAPPLTPTVSPAMVAPGAPPGAAPPLGPTVIESPPSHQPWSSSTYGGPPVAPPMGPPGGTTGSMPVAAPMAPPPMAPPPMASPPMAPGAGPPAALASYQDAGVGALPLPPPAARPSFGALAPTQVTSSMNRGPGFVGAPPAPMTPAPTSTTAPGARPMQGGIVFLIIGLSAVIAILILIVIWALWLR